MTFDPFHMQPVADMQLENAESLKIQGAGHRNTKWLVHRSHTALPSVYSMCAGILCAQQVTWRTYVFQISLILPI